MGSIQGRFHLVIVKMVLNDDNINDIIMFMQVKLVHQKCAVKKSRTSK